MCEAVVDCPHSTPIWMDSGYVVLRNQNIKDGRLNLSQPSFTDEEHFKQRIRRMAPRPGDIVITREAPMGEVCKIPEGLTCCLGQRQVLLRPKADVDADYLLYALQSTFVQNQIRWNEGTGSTVSNIRIPVLEKIEIPRHDQAETSIAKILSSVDSKIDLDRRINQTLEAMAQAIFKSWFVDFDPVKAKIAAIQQGQAPLRAAMRAISGKTDAELDHMPREHHDQLAATAALFPDEMEESELGEIPLGWKVAPASVVIEFNPKEPLRKGTVAPYLDMASLPTSGSWAESPVPREFGSGMRFRNGDALLARITPCLENGKSAFVQNLPDEAVGWGSTEFIVMRSKKFFPQEYAYLLMRHAAFREHAIRSMTGTSGRQRAQAHAVAEFKVVVPSDNSVWCALSEFVGPSFKCIKSQSEVIETLVALRDTLLPKLLTGELPVVEMEVPA